jgi:hypothetical protein
VIENGAGGEPLSCKDAQLLAHAAHLVLDGLNVAAAAASADTVFSYAPARVISTVQHALDERAKTTVDPPPLGDSEQEGFASVGVILNRGRGVVDLSIAGRLADSSRAARAAGLPSSGRRRRDRCSGDRYRSRTRRQQRCDVVQFHSHGATPSQDQGIFPNSRIAAQQSRAIGANTHKRPRQQESMPISQQPARRRAPAAAGRSARSRLGWPRPSRE